MSTTSTTEHSRLKDGLEKREHSRFRIQNVDFCILLDLLTYSVPPALKVAFRIVKS